MVANRRKKKKNPIAPIGKSMAQKNNYAIKPPVPKQQGKAGARNVHTKKEDIQKERRTRFTGLAQTQQKGK